MTDLGVNTMAVQMEMASALTQAEMSSDEEFVGSSYGLAFWLSAAWLAFVILAAIFAPMIIDDPAGIASIDIPNAKKGPSFGNWFGTNSLGTDVFALCMYGARTSLTVGVAAIAFGMLVGGTLGIVSGFLGGKFDRIFSFIFLLLLSFPALLLALFIINSLGRTLFWVTFTIGILSIPSIGRLARAQTLTFAQREFVTASRALGAKNGRVMIREILPNVMMPMLALALLGMAIAIVAEGTLSFIGVGPSDSAPSWGKLISLGTDTTSLEETPWLMFAPIGMIFFTILSLNYMGDQIRKRFDVKDIPL